MTGKLVVLGSGHSTGVPRIGNDWGACDPNNPKNNRSRASVAVMVGQTVVIVDTGPDFRHQMNRENISRVDAVLYSHAHGDHIDGIGDLRVLAGKQGCPVDVYGTEETLMGIHSAFRYLFEGRPLYPQVVRAVILKDLSRPCDVGDVSFRAFEQDHGSCTSLGFRFGSVAYSTDMVNLDERALEVLRGIETWIVDGAAYNQTGNVVHANLHRIFELNAKIGARKVYVTHLTAAMDYDTLCSELPPGYAPAYDGLVINL